MKKIIILITLNFFIIKAFNQVGIYDPIEFYICENRTEAKRIIKRFDKAIIGKDLIITNDFYYIELEENDINEYFIFLGIKFYCIPKLKRKKIQTIEMFIIG
jgi:hypothetical protein